MEGQQAYPGTAGMADLAVSMRGTGVEPYEGSATGVTSDDRPSEAALTLGRQTELIHALDDLAATIEARLGPILAPPHPGDSVKQDLKPVSSPLAQAVQQNNDKIERILSRLYEVQARIEV